MRAAALLSLSACTLLTQPIDYVPGEELDAGPDDGGPPKQLGELAFSPDSWDAGRVGATDGGEASFTFELVNDGGVRVDGIVLETVPAFAFTLAGAGCPSLDAGTSCAVQVRFAPATWGPHAATLRALFDGGFATARLAGWGSELVRVTVQAPDSGDAIIRSDGGIACGTACAQDVERGTTLDLDATLLRGCVVSSWSEPGCLGPHCGVLADGPKTVIASVSCYNFAFVTSGSYNSDRGVGYFDSQCAAQAGFAALPGASSFVALVARPGLEAWQRPELQAARGWVRVDGQPFVDHPDQLDGGILTALLTQDGQWQPSTYTWMGTAGANCSDWTAPTNAMSVQMSVSGVAAGPLLPLGSDSCGPSLLRTIFCMGTSRRTPLQLSIPPGARRAFYIRSFLPSLAVSPDEACQAEGAALGGQFRALIAMPGVSAASRFDLDGGTWYRIDGVPLFRSALGLGMRDAGPGWLAPIAVEIDGGRPGAYTRAWMGAQDRVTPGTATSTCDGWTNPSGTANCMSTNSLGYSAGISQGCTTPSALFCLEL